METIGTILEAPGESPKLPNIIRPIEKNGDLEGVPKRPGKFCYKYSLPSGLSATQLPLV